ncbi:MAG: phosphoenolpyruvate synthase [Anaerolineae bacterium]|nr:phosphoenolpyruvate synthase [Anaerolineae bacterium]
MAANLILPLDSPNAALALAGGKGANLAILTRAGFPVPPGFIVTTDAYSEFVRANDLHGRILARINVINPQDHAALETASAEIHAWFNSARISAALSAAILDGYMRLINTQPVAVRSSATAEDLPGLSFAGQHDTFLNVIGSKALLDAVKKCWASLWTARAIGYRARSGIASESVALAVVVQVMIAAQVAGVAFTADPLSGNRFITVINANPGLGEAIVAGQVEPDHYQVDHRTWQIAVKRLGAKAIAILPRPGGGTERIALNDAATQALSDEHILELARLCGQAAEYYGTPQDIEWALANDALYLLQARPITSLYPLPTHAPRDRFDIYFSVGEAQGVLDPFTPMGIDAIRRLTQGIMHEVGANGHALDTPDDAGMRLFVDITLPLSDSRLRRVLETLMQNVMPSVLPLVHKLVRDPRFKTQHVLSPRVARGALTFLFPIWCNIVRALRHPDAMRKRIDAQVDESIRAQETRAAGTVTFDERLDVIQSGLEEIFRQGPLAYAPLIAGGLLPLVLIRRLAPVDNDVRTLALELTRGLPHNVTTKMNLDLWARSQRIRADDASRHAFKARSISVLVGQYTAHTLPSVAQHELNEFLAQYGMRGVAEIDLGRPRWREDPTPLLNLVKSYLELTEPKAAPDVVFARGAQQAQARLDELVARLRQTRAGRMKARIVRAAFERLRALGGLRESPKLAIIRALGIYRELLVQCGVELAQAGTIECADDIFFLSLDELRGREASTLSWTLAIRTHSTRLVQSA